MDQPFCHELQTLPHTTAVKGQGRGGYERDAKKGQEEGQGTRVRDYWSVQVQTISSRVPTRDAAVEDAAVECCNPHPEVASELYCAMSESRPANRRFREVFSRPGRKSCGTDDLPFRFCFPTCSVCSDEVCRPFGFGANDVVVTPLGIEVTIIGVKAAPAPPPPEGADGEPPAADGYSLTGNAVIWIWIGTCVHFDLCFVAAWRINSGMERRPRKMPRSKNRKGGAQCGHCFPGDTRCVRRNLRTQS